MINNEYKFTVVWPTETGTKVLGANGVLTEAWLGGLVILRTINHTNFLELGVTPKL
jgi:hypothetical protein